MTPALKAMVEAMFSEMKRQIGVQAHASATVIAVRYDKPNYLGEVQPNIATISGSLDLEKVARAGLEALQNLDSGGLIDLILAGAEMEDSVGVWWPRLVDAILKDQP